MSRVPPRTVFALLLRYLAPQRALLALLLLLVFARITTTLLQPMIMQRFIDSALTDPDLRHLLRLALWLLVTGLAASATTVIAKVLTVTVAWRATNQLRTDLLSHLLSRDLLTLQSMSPGELAERVDGDVNQFQAFLSVFVIELVAGALLLIGIHIALLIVDWRLAIGLLAATIGLLVLSEWVRKKGVPLQRSLRESAGHLFGFVTDVITARVDIQTCGARDHVVRRLWGRLIRHYHADRRARLLGLLLLQTGSLTYALLNVVALATGAMMYIYGTATIGTAYALFRYVGMIRSPIERLVGELTSLQRAASAMSRLLELLQLQRSIVDGATRIARPGASAPIAFEKVTFSYGRGVPALRNVTFHLESGMRLWRRRPQWRGKVHVTAPGGTPDRPCRRGCPLGRHRSESASLAVVARRSFRRRAESQRAARHDSRERGTLRNAQYQRCRCNGGVR